MGIFNILSLALLALGTFAAPESLIKKLKAPSTGKKWVVLVAGSNGWENYRHQADICHAYQIVRKHGIPKENIITMMYDDIANNEINPTPGVIINKPNGTNVYSGVEIDYKGHAVTPHNFIKVITGNQRFMKSIGSGKVVKGGPEDTIFINFVDHGTVGALGFPNTLLYAHQLNRALNKMHSNKSYKEMLIYVEACESGSMFQGILSNTTNIAVVTASNADESSWACYCDDESGIYETCLGDAFSCVWMEDDDEMELKSSSTDITVFDQYQIVKSQVNDSHVSFYGDSETASKTLSTFIGYPKERRTKLETILTNVQKKMTVSSRDVPRHVIDYKIGRSTYSSLEKNKLKQKLIQNNKMRLTIDSVFRRILSEIVISRPDIKDEIGEINQPKLLDLSLDMFPCYSSILDQISSSCFSLPKNPYTLGKLRIFANLCIVDKNINPMVQDIVVKSCSNIPKTIINVF